jgi:3-hydroxybutyryl-CoA dehydrogenase
MGTSIFLYMNRFDLRLRWLCSSVEARDEARKLFWKKLNSQLHCGVMRQDEYDARLVDTVITADPRDMQDCNLIIEAVPEDADLKRQVFCQLDLVVNESCIFATNSSSIFPDSLIPSENRKDKLIGLHFFFPVQLKKYVEMIITAETSQDTIRSVDEFLAFIRKKSIHEDVHSAFLLNRLFLDFQAEAYCIFLEGKASFRQIDALVKTHLFPFGVFEFFDHVGIDVMLASVKAYGRDRVNIKFYEPLIIKLQDMVSRGQLGLKAKQGFYDYSQQTGPRNRMEPDEKLPFHLAYELIMRLWDRYISSVIEVLDAGWISREELSEAVKDYTGQDKDHFLPPVTLLPPGF